MKPQLAVIFDMDGLMVDTEPLSRRAWEETLQAYGQRLDDGTYGRMIGLRADESAQLVLDNFALPVSREALMARKAAAFAAIRAAGVPVMPGLHALLDALAARGLPWAVATSTVRRQAEAVLAQIGLAGAYQALAGGDEVAAGKPAPDLYLLAAQRLGVAPAHCLALEDSAPGCQAAVAAGMHVVAVPNGDTKTADFSLAHAVFPSLQGVADRLDELLPPMATATG
jgi:HAD superfamily hydrolase (TIGR01509 family)